MRAEPFGQRVPCLARPGKEDALAPQVAPCGERPDDRLGHEALRHDVRRHTVTREGRGRRGPDGRYGHSPDVARCDSPIGQPAAHHAHRVLTREHHPVVTGQVGEGRAQGPEVRERLDPDGRDSDDLSAERRERIHELGGLLTRAGDHDASPRKGARRKGLPGRL